MLIGSPKCIRPENPEQLAATALRGRAAHRTIRLGGNFSKDRLGGAPDARGRDDLDCFVESPAAIRAARLDRSAWRRACRLPNWAHSRRASPDAAARSAWLRESTVGGVVAANLSGPRRRLYGTARDMVIGMTFATLEGKLINSGGMVVKNVAGLDMAKLMIGSFGTLAAIATVNFKVFPVPVASRTFVMEFATRGRSVRRTRPDSEQRAPARGDRHRELAAAASGCWFAPEETRQCWIATRANCRGPRRRRGSVWDAICEFSRDFWPRIPSGRVVAMTMPLSKMCAAAESLDVPFIARAGSGVIYAHYLKDAPEIPLGERFCDHDKSERNVRS